MGHQPTILLSMGTRPEIIKMAPVYHQFKKSGIKPVLLHTGQHNDMATELYDLFDMRPDYSIDLGRQSLYPAESALGKTCCPLSDLSRVLMQHIAPVLAEVAPAVVLVHGDTTSALVAALAAFYQKIPVAHVEAGLRSHDPYHPFPEEKNRELIARIAQWHFAPTMRAKQNLLAEGIKEAAISMVGNTIVEAAQMGAEHLDELIEGSPQFLPEALRSLPVLMEEKHYRILLVTAHRRENQASTIHSIAAAVRDLLEQQEDLVVVWPVHPNPQVTYAVHAALDDLPEKIAHRLYLAEPLRYPVLLWVLKHSWAVLTDSGGIQEEAVALRVPVLVSRETTERPEVMESGAGLLVGTRREVITAEIRKLYENKANYDMMRSAVNPFGDGHSAAHICHTLIQELTIETPDSEKRFHG